MPMQVQIRDPNLAYGTIENTEREDWLTDRVDAVLGQLVEAWHKHAPSVISVEVDHAVSESLGQLQGLLGWTSEPAEAKEPIDVSAS